MRAYSIDLRQRVLWDCDAGLATPQAAAKYRVSASWVRRLLQRRRATGETAPRPCGRRPRTWAPHAEAIRAAVRDDPDATLAELKARLGLTLSLTTLWRAVAALGLTVKKKSAAPPSRTAPTSRRSGPTGGRRCGRRWTRPG
jgi:transposase